MNCVIRHIEYLLSRHDCVIVPGLGAFLAHDVEAQFDSESGFYNGPRRTYAFNSELKESDGLLIASVSKGLRISHAEATERVEEAVRAIKSGINQNGEFTFNRIGRLGVSLLGQLIFTPFATDRLTPLFDWIETPLTFSEKKSPPLITALRNRRPVEPLFMAEDLKPSRWKGFLRTALGAAAAIIIALIVSTPLSVKNSYQASTVLPVTIPVAEQNSVDRNMNIAESSYSTIPEQSDEPAAPLEDKAVAETTASVIVSEPEKGSISEENKNLNVAIPFSDNDAYVLVVASFSSREDAERFIVEYAFKCDYPLGITEGDDRYRVYAATGSSRSQVSALAQSPRITRHFKGAWVSVKES